MDLEERGKAEGEREGGRKRVVEREKNEGEGRMKFVSHTPTHIETISSCFRRS